MTMTTHTGPQKPITGLMRLEVGCSARRLLALVWPDQDLGRAVCVSVLGLPDHSVRCLEPGPARAERSRWGTACTPSRWDGGRDQDPGSRAQGPTPPTRVGVMRNT